MKRATRLLALSLFALSLYAETPDTILLHGKVYTGDPAHFAQAIAIGGKRITAVGTDAIRRISRRPSPSAARGSRRSARTRRSRRLPATARRNST